MKRFIHWLKQKFHRCSHEGCWEKGIDCYLPDNVDGNPDEWVCAAHAQVAGYCYACGTFWGGIESFDFRRSGLCDNCESDLHAEDFDEDDFFGELP